jgi:acetoin utilization protein AcuB
MHKEFAVISPETSIREAFHLLDKSQLQALPLMENGVLKSLVTRRQLEAKIAHLLMSGMITDFEDVVSPMVEGKLITLAPDAIIEEAAHLLQKHGLEAIPVVESDDTLVGIITERDVLAAFGEMLGVKSPGSRLTIRVDDEPGRLADIANAIREYGLNILSVAAHQVVEGLRDVVLRISTDNPQDIVTDLRRRGYKVVHVCQVWH